MIALGAGAGQLFIQVTAIGSTTATNTSQNTGVVNVSTHSGTMRWHVSINNPEAQAITARFVAAGFGAGGPIQNWSAEQPLTVPGGGSLVLQ